MILEELPGGGVGGLGGGQVLFVTTVNYSCNTIHLNLNKTCLGLQH